MGESISILKWGFKRQHHENLNPESRQMALYNYINRIERMDTLIRRKSTGTPKELAEKLNISERWLYIFLDELRSELDCPIRYDRRKKSYVYEIPGRIAIGFESEIGNDELKKVSGGKKFRNYFSLYL